jgi:hypothetical protein
MVLKHLDTTMRKSADVGETLLFSSFHCHINAPLSVKMMRTNTELTSVYAISVFLLFMGPRSSSSSSSSLAQQPLFEPRPSSEASASYQYSLQHSSNFSPPTSWHLSIIIIIIGTTAPF